MKTAVIRPIFVWLMAGFLGLLNFSAVASGVAPRLQSDSTVATAGYYRLSWQWEGAGEVDFELEEARDVRFAEAVTMYRGPDLATVFSGRSNGDYFYRVRVWRNAEVITPWSNMVSVKVQHHPLWRAFAFLGAGALVFLATLVLIVRGARRGGDDTND